MIEGIRNIFSDIPRGQPLETYEEHLHNKKKQNYKELLQELYTNRNMSQFDISKLLGMKDTTLSRHIKLYNIKKKESKVNDSNKIMYKTPSIIEKETGRKFTDIYNELIEQGLSLTEIAIKLQIKNISTITSFLKSKKDQEEFNNLDENSLVIKGLKNRNINTVEKMFKEQLGMTYKEWLEQKYINEGLSVTDIIKLTGISKRSTHNAIKRYGLSKSLSQARKDAIKKGRIDYEEINKKGMETRIKTFTKSNKQDLLRELLKHYLHDLTEIFPDIEIITGYSEYSILHNLEVDIPIIIFKGDKVYKIAIEYDGDIWHNKRESDTLKNELLSDKNWHLLRIKETSDESSNLSLVEEKAENIVNKVKEIILATD